MARRKVGAIENGSTSAMSSLTAITSQTLCGVAVHLGCEALTRSTSKAWQAAIRSKHSRR